MSGASGERLPGAPVPDPSGVDNAIDDSEDLDEEFVQMQKTISESRRRMSKDKGGDSRLQELLPFPFSPNIRPLTISDADSCVALENAAFTDPNHRCSPEKFAYRLTTCPEVCLGVFCTVVPSSLKDWDIDTLHTAKTAETGRPDGAVSVLLAHIVSTRFKGKVITDKAMDYPRDYKTKPGSYEVGHQEDGRTVCIHSLAVHPKLQGCGLGKLIMKSYMQQIKNSGTADRIALICQGYLVNYYARFGFTHVGESKAAFGGGGWHDMTFDLPVSPKN